VVGGECEQTCMDNMQCSETLIGFVDGGQDGKDMLSNSSPSIEINSSEEEILSICVPQILSFARH
jgi:hypothetical protein